MPAKTIEELEKQFTEMTSNFDLRLKDTELKLQTAQGEAKQYKELAEKREREIKEFRDKAEAAEKRERESAQKTREEEIAAFALKLKEEGRITPAMEDMVVCLMKSLSADGAVRTYNKDGRKIEDSQFSLFKQILSMFPKEAALNFSEGTHAGDIAPFTPDDSPGAGVHSTQQFVEVFHEGVKKKLPLQDADLDQKARAYMDQEQKNGRPVDYATALCRVSPRNKG